MTQLRHCIHGDPISPGTDAWWKSLNWLDERVGVLDRGASMSDIDGIQTPYGLARDIRFYDDNGRLLYIETKHPDEVMSNGQRWAIQSIGAKPRCVYVLLRGESEERFHVSVMGLTSWAGPVASHVPVDGWMEADSFASLVRSWWAEVGA